MELIMKITKEQIKQAYESPEKLKEFFPEAFEVEIKIGNWYKEHLSGSLFCVTSEDRNGHLHGYGFRKGEWFCSVNEKDNICACNSVAKKSLKEASHKEVEEALINEAKKRGYKSGNHICLYNKSRIETDNIYSYNATYNLLNLGSKCASVVFVDGNWAEIIPDTLEVTLDQVAEKFGVEKIKIINKN